MKGQYKSQFWKKQKIISQQPFSTWQSTASSISKRPSIYRHQELKNSGSLFCLWGWNTGMCTSIYSSRHKSKNTMGSFTRLHFGSIFWAKPEFIPLQRKKLSLQPIYIPTMPFQLWSNRSGSLLWSFGVDAVFFEPGDGYSLDSSGYNTWGNHGSSVCWGVPAQFHSSLNFIEVLPEI